MYATKLYMSDYTYFKKNNNINSEENWKTSFHKFKGSFYLICGFNRHVEISNKPRYNLGYAWSRQRGEIVTFKFE